MSAWTEALRRQFDAALTTLERALEACPDQAWSLPVGRGVFWRAAYHALFYLDLYAGESDEGFAPPDGFCTTELEEDGAPPREYTRAELLGYAAHCRAKVHARLAALTDEDAARPSGIAWLERRGLTTAEAWLYNVRHVQHHAAQLNLALRQAEDLGAAWIFADE